jgi:hypothetical protein
MTPRAYPLQWPAGWPKTPPEKREHAKFKTTLAGALANLKRQVQLMGGREVLLSSNSTLGNENPKDPGVCAYFQWCADLRALPEKWQSMAIPCDRWNRIEFNVQAIALTVEAMRGMERWGAKHMITAMFTGFKALPAATRAWWEVLGLESTEPLEGIKVRYRNLVKIHHPDNGGDPDRFREIQQAYEFALERGT